MVSINNISIEQQRAMIGIRTTNAAVQISTPHPQMRIISGNRPPAMDMQHDIPEFKVNWQKVRAESGLTPPVQKTKEIAGETQQVVLEYTAETAQDGNYLSRIDIGGNRVAEIYRRRTLEGDGVDINLGSMPQSPPEVQWSPGQLSINWENSQLEVEWDTDFRPTFSVEPHSVEIFLSQQPYIKITVVEGMFPLLVGRQFDAEV